MQKRYLHTFLSFLIICCGFKGYSQTYCVTSPTIGGTGDIITKVAITGAAGNTYTNTTTSSTAAPAYYTSYPNAPVDLAIGNANTISITFGSDPTQYSAVWIDFNKDGIFQANENVALTPTSTGANGTKTYTITVPAGTPLGTTTLRVRGGADGVYTAGGACTNTPYGETEDYKVNITGPVCTAPTAVTTTNVTTTSATLNFTAPIPAPGNGYDYFYTANDA